MNGEYRIGDVVLGSWTLVKLLGEGAYGKVYEAHREDFGTTYTAAIKVMTIPQSQSEVESARAEGMDEESVTAYFRSLVGDVVQEFALMSELKGTANIVSYEDHSVTEHSQGVGWDILIRMELLTPMIRYMEKHPMMRSDVIKLGIDMCKALELCQRYNIIHRDIKPENIFVSRTGDYKLGDFGVARTLERTTGGLSKKGTYTYMAPEIYRDEKYGSTVDIYSLGIVLYRLLNNNRAPFLPQPPQPITHSDRERALVRRFSGEPLPPPVNAEGRLSEIVLKACAFDPKDRYSSPLQMRMELEAIQYQRADDEKIYGKSAQIDVDGSAYTRGGRTSSSTAGGVSESDDEKTVYTGKKPAAVENASDDDKTVFVGKKPVAGGVKDAPKKKKTGLIAGIAVAVVALAAVLIFILPKDNKPPIEAEPTPQATIVAGTPEDLFIVPDLGPDFQIVTSPRNVRSIGALLLDGSWERGQILLNRTNEKAIRIRYVNDKLSSENEPAKPIDLTVTINFDADGATRLVLRVVKGSETKLGVGYAFYDKNVLSSEQVYFDHSLQKDGLAVDLDFPENFVHVPDEIKTVMLEEEGEKALFFAQPKYVNANMENRSLLQNVTVSDKGVVSWDPYPGATIYNYDIGNMGRGTNKTSLNLRTETKSLFPNAEGVYIVNIRADSADLYGLAEWHGCCVYSDEDLNAEDVVPSLEGAALDENGVLSWSAYPNVDHYVAKINNVEVSDLWSATSLDTGGALICTFGQRSDPCLISIEAQGIDGRVLARWRYLYTLPELPSAEEEPGVPGWVTVDTTGKEGELAVLSYYVSDGKKLSNPDAFQFREETWISFEWIDNTTTYSTLIATWGSEPYTEEKAREEAEFYLRLWRNDLNLPNNPQDKVTTGMPDMPGDPFYVLFIGLGKDGTMDCYVVFEIGIPKKTVSLDEKWSYGAIKINTIDQQTLHVELTDDRIPYGFPHSETPGNNYESWNLVLNFAYNSYGFINLDVKPTAKSLADVSLAQNFEVKGGMFSGKAEPCTLSGNTYSFNISIPSKTGLTVGDIQSVNVNMGTESKDLVDNHHFAID